MGVMEVWMGGGTICIVKGINTMEEKNLIYIMSINVMSK